jgi:uncharacterized protein YqhQ
VDETPVRLGGMALQNGVLVHGPTSWACAVRDEDGELHLASGRKPHLAPAARQRIPLLRGPIALAEAFALLPMVRRALPQARYPFERPAVLGSIVTTMAIGRALRASRMRAGTRELAAAGVALVPAAFALRGEGLAEYHGAEHISIGTYEQGGVRAPKEHPRCGSQLIPSLVASSLLANAVAAKVPRRARGTTRLVGLGAAMGGSLELFAWVARNPANPLARALARPGFELQKRFSTAEPSEEQVEVADAARDACLALERRETSPASA